MKIRYVKDIINEEIRRNNTQSKEDLKIKVEKNLARLGYSLTFEQLVALQRLIDDVKYILLNSQDAASTMCPLTRDANKDEGNL